MEDQGSLVILLYNDIIHTAMNKTPEIFKILRIRLSFHNIYAVIILVRFTEQSNLSTKSIEWESCYF